MHLKEIELVTAVQELLAKETFVLKNIRAMENNQ